MTCAPRRRLAPFSAIALLLAGCGGAVYQPSKVAGFDPDGAAEINDDDVKKAFEAKPQMGESFSVAYFSFDPTKETEIRDAIHDVPGVTSMYAIPAFMATGQRRFDETSAWPPRPAQPLSMKKLRLLAARAHCDVLVVVDYGNKVDVSVNGLVAFNVALLPALFLPFRDLKYTSYVEAFVIDTRNGYLYGHVSSEKQSEAKFETIYAADDAAFKIQWAELKRDLHASIVKLTVEERAASWPSR
jgi:hypothetical protein